MFHTLMSWNQIINQCVCWILQKVLKIDRVACCCPSTLGPKATTLPLGSATSPSLYKKKRKEGEGGGRKERRKRMEKEEKRRIWVQIQIFPKSTLVPLPCFSISHFFAIPLYLLLVPKFWVLIWTYISKLEILLTC